MRAFAASKVAGRDLDREEFPHDLWRAMGEAGLFRLGLAERFGGSGGGYAGIAASEAALVELGGSLGFGLSWAGHQMTARWFIEGFGSEAQQQEWLPGLAAGRSTAAVAISEPGAGAHPKLLATTATAEGDQVRLDGEKAWVTNGPIADIFVVLAIARLDGERKRYGAWLVPRGAAGLELVAMKPLGFLRPSPHCGLRLGGVRVPAANRLGPVDTAYEAMALPFRDVEDTVGTAALTGALQHLLAKVAAAAEPGEAMAETLGAIAAQVAVMREAARAATAALDAQGPGRGEAAALTMGVRVMAAGLVQRIRGLGLAAAAIAPMLRDLDASFGIARGPRQARLRRLGMSLLR